MKSKVKKIDVTDYVTRTEFRESMQHINNKFESVDRRFETLEKKFDDSIREIRKIVAENLEDYKRYLGNFREEMFEKFKAQADANKIFWAKFENHERRISRLENGIIE